MITTPILPVTDMRTAMPILSMFLQLDEGLESTTAVITRTKEPLILPEEWQVPFFLSNPFPRLTDSLAQQPEGELSFPNTPSRQLPKLHPIRK